MSRRGVDRLHLVLMLGYWGVCAALWAELPERMPHHFGFSGRPTSWARTSPFLWFGLPALAVAMWAFLRAMARVGDGTPDLWNVPHKDRFLKLPTERRALVTEELKLLMSWLGVSVTVSFVAIQIAIYETATGRTDGFSLPAQLLLWAAIISMIAVPIAWMPRVRRRIEEAER